MYSGQTYEQKLYHLHEAAFEKQNRLFGVFLSLSHLEKARKQSTPLIYPGTEFRLILVKGMGLFISSLFICQSGWKTMMNPSGPRECQEHIKKKRESGID